LGNSASILEYVQTAIEVGAVDQSIGGHPNVTGLDDLASVRTVVDQPIGCRWNERGDLLVGHHRDFLVDLSKIQQFPVYDSIDFLHLRPHHLFH
jgi:hypothetical protein